MNVGELMTRSVRTCMPTDMLSCAARAMWEGDCGCVPIVDTNSFVMAMLTDRDICMAAYLQGKPLHEIPICSAMSTQLFTCKSDDSIEAAETIMRRHQVRRLPVTDLGGRLVGLLSLNDITRHIERSRHNGEGALSSQAVAQTLAAICSPPRPAPPNS
ncbi:MAG: CBS domain-containing protein [Polyangiaceae bacterium]|nr:CBS domain-containing protein [Polyangiaceae bacterium]NUQ73089.1 CBS domain-containing protein [Polyangiaceae bacterium]